MVLQGDPFHKGLAVCGPEQLPIGACADVSTACGMLPLAQHKEAYRPGQLCSRRENMKADPPPPWAEEAVTHILLQSLLPPLLLFTTQCLSCEDPSCQRLLSERTQPMVSPGENQYCGWSQSPSPRFTVLNRRTSACVTRYDKSDLEEGDGHPESELPAGHIRNSEPFLVCTQCGEGQ